ncbi:MAG TPA: hypothetical protein VNO30_30655 [Kofleriaceae bacterium]|nr:hypothetical protein [Kofleriaceae bacterium]
MRAAERASPRARTKHKRFGWGASTIRAILHNEKYAGSIPTGISGPELFFGARSKSCCPVFCLGWNARAQAAEPKT